MDMNVNMGKNVNHGNECELWVCELLEWMQTVSMNVKPWVLMWTLGMNVNCGYECELPAWMQTMGINVNRWYECESLVWMQSAGMNAKCQTINVNHGSVPTDFFIWGNLQPLVHKIGGTDINQRVKKLTKHFSHLWHLLIIF